jgi:hypothetical protein
VPRTKKDYETAELDVFAIPGSSLAHAIPSWQPRNPP